MIGYYIHHQGSGHMQTAMQVIPHISQPVVAFSSFPKPDNFPENATYVQLENDAVEGYLQPPNSQLMYTPFAPPVLRRYQQILEGVIAYNITCMYVDVSLEVALFCKTLGVKVGHNVLLGDRDDDAHSLLFSICDFYVSDNDQRLDQYSHRTGPDDLQYVGGMSRYKKVRSKSKPMTNVVITTSPESRSTALGTLPQTAKLYPHITWHLVGSHESNYNEPNIIVHGIVPDPKELYLQADVIVGGGGHNTIMEAASFAKRFVCIPEGRPYDEQLTAARALERNSMAVHLASFPAPDEWAQVFSKLETVDLEAFQSIVDDEASKRVAELIERSA